MGAGQGDGTATGAAGSPWPPSGSVLQGTVMLVEASPCPITIRQDAVCSAEAASSGDSVQESRASALFGFVGALGRHALSGASGVYSADAAAGTGHHQTVQSPRVVDPAAAAGSTTRGDWTVW